MVSTKPAAAQNSVAYAPVGEEHTAFSGELIRVLKDGINIDTEFITLDNVYEIVRQRIATNPSLPSPQRKIELDLGDFVLAKNVAWSGELKDSSSLVSDAERP